MSGDDHPCPTCGRDDFDSRKAMRSHHKQVHGESLRKAECPECGEAFLRNHDDEVHCSMECRKRAALVVVECEVCGDEFTEKRWRVESRGRVVCSEECRAEWLEGRYTGEEHPQWEGGHPRYMGKNWPEWRRRVIERDGMCLVCGSEEDLEVHHIEPRREFDNVNDANTMNNLVTLCSTCHPKVEHGRVECPTPGGIAT